jgi:hypothetical protein
MIFKLFFSYSHPALPALFRHSFTTACGGARRSKICYPCKIELASRNKMLFESKVAQLFVFFVALWEI